MKYAGAYIDESRHTLLSERAKSSHRKLPDFIRLIFDGVLDGTIPVPNGPLKAGKIAKKPAPRTTKKGARAA